ncbi:MAG: nitroreductase family protein [Verrucomicrobiota bacterium]
MSSPTENQPPRISEYPVHPLILKRWSPRAMSGEPLSTEEISTLFEAGRWAPSTANEQEWKFLYARQNSKSWNRFFNLLEKGNQAWCKNAAVLVLIIGRKCFQKTGKPNPVHAFDCGNAFQNIALQATEMNLVVHPMAGFNYEQARVELQVPETHDVIAMFAAGRHGDPNQLQDSYKVREFPSTRLPLSEIVTEIES